MFSFNGQHLAESKVGRRQRRWQWGRVFLLGIGLSSLLVSPAIAQPKQYKTFHKWCVNRAKLTPSQQITIDALLEVAKTQNCDEAHAFLSQARSLSFTKKNISDLSPFASFPQLTSLILAGNPIRDVSPLSTLTNLTFLIVAFGEVEDVSSLASLTNVTYLVLDNNQIQDMSPLKTLTKLRSLVALNNPLKSSYCPVLPVTICAYSDISEEEVVKGMAHNDKGEYDLARQAFNKARVQYEGQDDPMRLGDVINLIADLDLKVGRYADAVKGYEAAIALRRQVDDLPGIGVSLVQQAKAFEQLGLYEQSEARLIEATENSEKQWTLGIPLVGGLYELPKDTGALYQNLALVQNRLGKPQLALDSAQKSLKNYNRLPDGYAGKRVGHQTTLTTMGMSYLQLKQYSRAQTILDQALTMARTHSDSEGIGQILTHMAELSIASHQYKVAIQYLKEALALQIALGNKPAQGKTLHLLGISQLQHGQSKQSIQTLLLAVEIWESLRPGLADENKVALFETQLATYEQLQYALLAQNKYEAALEISERGRARAFVELMATQINGNVNETLQQAKPPSISEIRAIAKTQNATLVEYSIVGDRLVIWVIQPSGEIEVRTTDLSALSQSLGKTAERSRLAAKTGSVRGASQHSENMLTDIVREDRQALLEMNPDEDARASVSLSRKKSSGPVKNRRLHSTYQLLIEPIADLLPPNPEDRVVIIPQGPLFLVPFATLQDDQGQYLIERHTLSMSPAISVLELTHQIKATRQSANRQPDSQDIARPLIVGNPRMPSIPLSYGAPPTPLLPLPGAESEALAIAELFTHYAFIGGAAEEYKLSEKMESASMIHLATHGLLDELKYMGINVPGAIALTPTGNSPERDGLLTSEEIMAMDLRADLVVLSACNTGRGKITGDGVVGLSRSFISAGAPSVVVSLWAVPDAPTSVLMQAFYQQLKTEPDKAKALRLAMLETLKQYSRPQDWGAFMLIGEAD